MKFVGSLIAVGLWAGTGTAAFAELATLAEDAKAFGTRAAASQAAISPSGDKVVMLVAGPGRQTLAKVFDLKTGAAATALASPGNPETLNWCQFASDTQLVCRYSANLDTSGQVVGFSRLVTLGIDGKGLKLLGQQESFYDSKLRQFDGAILDWLPGEQGAVLMAREYVPETGRTGSNISRTKEGLGVDKIDLKSLKADSIEPPDRLNSGFMTDGKGNVRVRIRDEVNGNGILTGRTTYAYRISGSREWKKLGEYESSKNTGIYPLAIEAESNSLFALEKLDGRDALFRVSLDGSGAKTLVAKNDFVDIGGVERFGRGQRVIAYHYAEDRAKSVYFDPEFQRMAGALGKALPTSPLIDFAGASADGNSLLIFAGSATNPGSYYFLDRKSSEMAELATVRPALADKKLSPVTPIQYKSRDGAVIPGYVTIPAGSSGKAMPAVVLPHGGPSSRDEWGFDWLAQFLAARGYVVIQPNYRGSSGYGEEFLNGNGFRNWQTSIGDVLDSARHLVSEGIADPNRLAIVGWSYGGYAALQSAAIEPDMFKAVVAIAPVTDLGLLKRESRGFTNSELVKDFVGSGTHVRDGSPLRNVAAIKAPVLLVHGDLDANVGVQHSLSMASALKAAGKPIEMLRFDGLDHQLEDSNARVDMLTKVGQALDSAIGH